METIGRAFDCPPSAVENVRVDHGSARVTVPEQLLHRADVVPAFQEMCRERMTERVARARF